MCVQVPSGGKNKPKIETQTRLVLSEAAEDKVSKLVWGYTCN